MARSRNLSSYDTIYFDLLSAMKADTPEITLRLPRKLATNTQQTFYAFIRAMEHTANVKSIGNDVKHAQSLTNDANVMRGYLVVLKHEEAYSILRFVNRDMNPETQTIRDQIHAQLKNHTPQTKVEVESTESADDFFKSLKIGTDDNET